MFFYQAYGLNIASEIQFGELLPGGTGEDVCIVRGPVTPPKLEPTSIKRQGIEALFAGNKQEAYLKWPGVVTLLAVDGSRLIVQPDSESVDSQLLNLYILSEALGLILYQKGLFLLHASAVKIGEQVTVFLGRPGAGKSTTAAAFATKGYGVFSDDMVAISLNTHPQPVVLPGFPQVKIWPSAVEGIGCLPSTVSPLFPGSRKQVLRPQKNFPLKPLPVNRIFLLEHLSPEGDAVEQLRHEQKIATNLPGEENPLKIVKMEPREAFLALTRFFPCPSGLLKATALQHHSQQCANLLTAVEAWKWQRPKDFQMLNLFVTAIEQGTL